MTTAILFQKPFMLLYFFSERKIPPTFTKKPTETLEDTEGKMVKIEARLSGSQPMTINWYKDDIERHSSDHYDMSFKSNVAVLCIKSSEVSDCGRYTCKATNEAGTASCEVTVTITGRSILLLLVYFVVFLHRKRDVHNFCMHFYYVSHVSFSMTLPYFSRTQEAPYI